MFVSRVLREGVEIGLALMLEAVGREIVIQVPGSDRLVGRVDFGEGSRR
jgi:hypothetical protein